ncbi:MAG TPA: cell surface protein SprA [Gemmatimonadaceae bacterium]|nr:cell surface protein SprA [Gemmatimonadaceae bacterium]
MFRNCIGALAALGIVVAPIVAAGQGGGDTLAYPGIRFSPAVVRAELKLSRIPWNPPPPFNRFGLALMRGDSSRTIAAGEVRALTERLAERRSELWIETMTRAREAGVGVVTAPVAAPVGPLAPRDSGFAAIFGNLLADDSPIGVQLGARFESKVDRTRNERCTANQLFSLASQCAAGFQPAFNLDFDMRAGGSIADRFFINVDYDSKREFRSSDNISLFYRGKSDELIERLEVGNVTLQLPPSTFITSGIPAGNYGIQAIGQIGPMKFRGIVAQQQGNIPKSYDVVVGDRTVKSDNRELEDYQVEPRRFFFTIDPRSFPGYPNIDLLNGVQMRSIAEALPETLRPRRLFVYRLVLGGQPPNPNGPRFQVMGDPKPSSQVYELLQENKDYYTDPSQLWIALKRSLNLQNERLVVAYTLRIGGRDTVIAELGGTPDVAYDPTHPQLAHLLWDPQVRPTDSAFVREIRSIYKVAGQDLRRSSVTMRILTGGGVGQEKPLAGVFDTYLQMFGLAQSGNAALFDLDNRLWPRPSDPNTAVGIGSATAKIIDDYYVVMPSVRPFAANGLVQPGNPLSDTIYVTPSEDLYSQQHPQSHYRLQLHYDIDAGSTIGTVTLGAQQLRRNSELVQVDGVTIAREKDYTIDYELGMITFTRPDTLFIRPRRVSVRYEENPDFAAAPTSILAFSGQIPMERGELGLTMISQSQSTAFTRPPLGYEPQSSFIAGLTGRFDFDAAALSRLIEKWPTVHSTTVSRIGIAGEFATSRPQPNKAGQAFVQTFEGEGGIQVPLQEAAWHYSSQPALGLRLPQRLGAETFDLVRASTMAWQGTGLSRAHIPVQFTLPQIDPQVSLSGSGVNAPEPMLWLTLYPLSVGGLLNSTNDRFLWTVEQQFTRPGRRWRSLVAPLGASGQDLSRVEYIEFWTLVDTSTAKRATNPAIVLDIGDLSENSVAFGPTLLTLTQNASGGVDSTYSGKALMGFDMLDTERDSLSRGFNQATNDKGLPGDVVSLLTVVRDQDFTTIANFPTCSRGAYQVLLLGDARNNCTVKNGRLDEEDIDLDNTLNLTANQREQERLRRYIIDLSNTASYNRLGKCSVAAFDTAAGGTVSATDLCWVRVRVPFSAPDDSLNGGPNIRRIRAVRLTLVSGEGTADTAFTTLPIALFKFQGSPLIKRSDRTVSGIAGDATTQGFVIASVIGTQDRDSLRLNYEPPPGVTDAAEKQQTGLESVRTQINEKSLRLQVLNLQPFERAEAYERFPEGARNFMNYKELRVWARGRGAGWGLNGDLQFYVKIGRDANNFYLYRTDINSGQTRDAWSPEVRVDFTILEQLRTQLQSSLFREGADSIACTGVDSILIARSGVPVGQPINRHAVCAGGYIVYSADPAVNPPSLAQVQELAVGMVRVANGTGMSPILPADTLELWVDEVRLTNVENTPGYAGQLSVNVAAGDVASFVATASRTDPHFRQLGEQPTFLGNDGVSFATSIKLDKLMPGAAGFSIPLTISHAHSSSNPLFLSQSDIVAGTLTGLRTPETDVTRYDMTMRRAVLMRSGWGLLVNNTQFRASYSHADSRSEFTDGSSKNWALGMDYSLQSALARYAPLPSWLGGSKAKLRWNPTQFRVSADLGHNADNRLAFSKPVVLESDPGRRVTGLSNLLRTSALAEFRPLQPLTVTWNYGNVRDLRDYGDTSATAIIASHEREKLWGVDLGLERERQMNSSVRFEPAVASYFHPSVSFITGFTMQRDPQSRQLVRTEDSTGAFRLPRRLSNIRSLTAGSVFDPGRALKRWFGAQGKRAAIADRFQQLDISWSHTLTSSFDGAPFTPGFGYQFAAGGLDAFLEHENQRATIAAETQTLVFSTGFKLRNDLNLTTRMQTASTDNYTRRLDNTQAVIQGRQQTLPNIGVRWSDSLPWLKRWQPFGEGTFKPFGWMHVVSTVGFNGAFDKTRNATFAPGETADATGDRRVGLTRHYGPFSAAVNYVDVGGLNTTFRYDLIKRTDSVPGSLTATTQREIAGDISRAFSLPRRWNLPGRLRTRFGWARTSQATFVTVSSADKPSRLADNGSTRLNLLADTDVMPRVKFSLQGTRVVTFDNNYNRRLSQMMLSAVFNLQYDIGNIGNMR